MAPSLKELEAASAGPNASAPASPQVKSQNEAASRPQPLALEIPITVNGARTVEGSDKRAPFSEATQTVLVFPHGAVIRINAALAPGQLVFLTNEKSKKEVVCQVVKSKSSGGSGAYVELQFTEPSPGFWGVPMPGASAPAPAARPAAPVAPAGPKAAPPAPPAPVLAKPPASAKPAVPPVTSAPPAKPATPPPVPPVGHPVPVVSHAEPLVTPPPPSPIAPPTPAPSAVAPPTITAEPVQAPSVSVAPPAAVVPESQAKHPPASHAPATHAPSGPASPLRDYSKQIEALFSTPQAPAPPKAPESHVAAHSSDPSTEQLKQEAARLQAQLSSMLFTEPRASAPPSPPPAKAAPPAAEPSKEVVDLSQEPKISLQVESKPTAPAEHQPAFPVRKTVAPALGADEEVQVPSWLAPLQHSEAAPSEPAVKAEAPSDASVSVNSEESYDALVLPDISPRPQTAVFGGQLLGESSASAPGAASSGSKKGLFIGMAAALLVLAGGAYYYFHQGQLPSTVAASHSAAPVTREAADTSNLSAAPAAPAPLPNKRNSAPALTTEPQKNSVPTPIPVVAASNSAPASKASKPVSKAPEPLEEPAKSSLGDVHLAAPVVNHADTSQPASDALQNIDTKTIPGDADAFASAADRRAGPAAPLPVGGDVKPAELLKSVPPVYPPLAKEQHVSGSVHIDALIDASGNVASVKVISGPTLLHRAALDAVKQWKYTPAMLDGQPTSMHLTVTVAFRAQ